MKMKTLRIITIGTTAIGLLGGVGMAAMADPIVEYGSVPSLLVPSSSPKIRAADPVLSRAFNHAECAFYAEHYTPRNPEIADRDWKTPFLRQCEDREAIAVGWIIDQWPVMSYEQYALCEVPYNRKLKEYGDTILAQIHMSYHGIYYMQELIRANIPDLTNRVSGGRDVSDRPAHFYFSIVISKSSI
jgi:hypothetical protein